MSTRKDPQVPRSQRASRSRGEQTRQEIVAATMRVIARNGVRGLTHRAVAQEAGVNLSLTTYYFVDLYDLVSSAFTTFMEGGHQELVEHWQRAFAWLDRQGPLARATPAVRARVRDYVATRICGYIERKIAEQPVGLAVEHHFFFEALLDPRLTELAARHRERLLAPMIELCRRFGSPDPATDADLLFGTVIRLEYEALLHEPPRPDMRRIRRVLRRLLDLLLGLA